MTEELLVNNLTQRLHPSLKNDFWIQFIEAVGKEVWLEHEEKFLKQSMFDVDTLTSEEICSLAQEMLGYTIDLSLSSDLNFVKKIFKAIPWLIVNKTIYDSFDFIFKSIGESGFVYLLYFNTGSSKLLKLLDFDSICKKIDTYTDFTTPFHWIYPDRTSSVDLLRKTYTLDSALFEVDGDETYYLDRTGELLTKHICLEYNLSKYELFEGVKYLFRTEYFLYLKNNGNYCKKATDVAHYGCNLTFPIDFRYGTHNYVPDLDLDINVTDFYDNSFTDLVIVGTVEYEDGTETDLGLYSISIDEINYYFEYILMSGLFKAKVGSKIFKNVPDLNDYTDSLHTKNIVANKVSGRIYLRDGSYIEFEDDGLGYMESSTHSISGIINYVTGDFTFYFYKYVTEVLNFTTNFTNIEVSLGRTIIKPLTVSISVVDDVGNTYHLQDDGNENIVGSITTASTINYATGIMYLDTTLTLVSMRVSFDYKSIFSTASLVNYIWIDYRISDSVKLKKVSVYTDIFNANNKIIEATFPYIEMEDIDQHVSLHFLIRAPGINLDRLDIGKRLDNTPYLRVDRSRRFI